MSTFFMLLWDHTRKNAGNIYQLCVHRPAPAQGLLKQQPGGKRAGWAWRQGSLALSYPSCFRNPWLGLRLGNGLLPSPAQIAMIHCPSAPLGYGSAPGMCGVSWGLPQP